MMENEIGSIVGYCYARNPVIIYDKAVPEGHKFPSMYFPVPISTSEQFTSSAYQKSYMMAIKVFDKDAQAAWAKAESIADSIRQSKWLIPMIDEFGILIDKKYVKVKTVSTRVLDHGEDGHMATVQLTIEWDSRYNYDQATYTKMGQVKFRVDAN